MPVRSYRATARGGNHLTIPSSLPTLKPTLQTQMSSPSLLEKIAFFDGLEALENELDDEIDDHEKEHRDKCRAFFSSKKRPDLLEERAPSQPRRTASMPVSNVAPANPRVIEATPNPTNTMATRRDRSTGDTTSVEETPVPETARPPPAGLRRSTTLPLAAISHAVDQSPSAISALRKRKRQSSTKSVPETAQIFRGLSFYYIPNNDIAPARRLRIAKAQEFGAQWARSLTAASHVIVDRNLKYKDIDGILGSTAPESLVIVNEDYPLDCLTFKALLNPDQHRYRVPGCPVRTGNACPEDPPAESQVSDRSLQVKEPRTSRRRNSGSPESTPSTSEPSLVQQVVKDVKECPENQNMRKVSGSIPTESAFKPSPQPGIAVRPPSPLERERPPDNVIRESQQASGPRDELSEYIEVMRQYKDLPLDEDEDEDDLLSVRDTENATSDSELEQGSEDERARKKTTATTRLSRQKAIPFEERFACNRGGTKEKLLDDQNPNARTIQVLQSMCDYYTRINDHWRTTAYRKAIATLRRQTTKITTEEEAFHLPNIGRRLAAKIEEIVSTNRLRRLEYANEEPLDQVLETFLKIYGVGLSCANKWVTQGFRTLDDLRSKADLTPNQRLGLEHYDDLNTRIPRDEVTALGEYVKREAAQLDASVELQIGGSYRRGSDTSGDIDLIVTKKGTTSSAELVPFLEELIAVLTRKGFLVATLAALHARRQGKDGPGSKWHGCCVLPREAAAGGDGASLREPIWRRIDFLLVPESEYGAALIYFTGNDIFNRSMRLLASKKGMRLNQRGLYKEVMRGKGRVTVTEGELVEGRDERRIFELLGVKWREPWERWC